MLNLSPTCLDVNFVRVTGSDSACRVRQWSAPPVMHLSGVSHSAQEGLNYTDGSLTAGAERTVRVRGYSATAIVCDQSESPQKMEDIDCKNVSQLLRYLESHMVIPATSV